MGKNKGKGPACSPTHQPPSSYKEEEEQLARTLAESCGRERPNESDFQQARSILFGESVVPPQSIKAEESSRPKLIETPLLLPKPRSPGVLDGAASEPLSTYAKNRDEYEPLESPQISLRETPPDVSAVLAPDNPLLSGGRSGERADADAENFSGSVSLSCSLRLEESD